MKLVFKTIIITFILTACSKKFSLDHYSLPCETSGIEVGDLYLLDNNKFFIHVKHCGGSIQSPAYSFGTYLKHNDTTFVLNSIDRLEILEVIESKSADSSYRIRVVDKNLSGAMNESSKIIIDNTDTISGINASMGLRFKSNSRTINTIQIYFPNLNFKTSVYSVKDKSNNQFDFKFNAEWPAITTFPSILFLDNFTLTKRDRVITGKSKILTRATIPTFIYAGSQRKRKNKILPKQYDTSKDVTKYLTEQTTSR